MGGDPFINELSEFRRGGTRVNLLVVVLKLGGVEFCACESHVIIDSTVY